MSAYIAGDHYVICDVCGFKKRRSETRKRWDNLIVCHADWEERHPQDTIKPGRPSRPIRDPRPEPDDVFI